MKKLFGFCLVLALLMPLFIYGQPIVFTVKSGTDLQSSQIGLSMGSLEPYAGLDLLSASGKMKISDTEWDMNWDTEKLYKSMSSETELTGSATLIIPHIGAKFFLSKNQLKPYLLGGIMKSFASVDVKNKSSAKIYDTSGELLDETESDESLLSDDTKDALKDLLSFWGINLGFGVEYTINKRISIGGEYTIHWLKTSTELKDEVSEDTDFDDVIDYRSETKTELSGSLKMSQAAIVLNFHF